MRPAKPVSKRPAPRASVRIVGWVLMIAIALGLIELASGYLIEHRADIAASPHEAADSVAICQREGIDCVKLYSDVFQLYRQHPRLNFYHWYDLVPNFSGNYIHTNAHGYRVTDGDTGSAPVSIGFFGGSTVFCVTNDDPGTLPSQFAHLLDPKQAVTLNYGIGGYATGAEITTFIEAVRIKKLDYAVFFDGDNEVGRFSEFLQDANGDSTYALLGYPYMDPIVQAERRAGDIGVHLQTVDLLRKVANMISRMKLKSIDELVTPDNADAMADRIVKIYTDNVKDIAAIAKSHGVTPVFFWQPTLLSANIKLTQHEVDLRTQHPGLALLYIATQKKIHALKPADVGGALIFDLSDSLDGIGDQPHFFDLFHVDNETNGVLAKAIASHLKGVVPDTVFAK